jgi:hypothetical protein
LFCSSHFLFSVSSTARPRKKTEHDAPSLPSLCLLPSRPVLGQQPGVVDQLLRQNWRRGASGRKRARAREPFFFLFARHFPTRSPPPPLAPPRHASLPPPNVVPAGLSRVIRAAGPKGDPTRPGTRSEGRHEEPRGAYEPQRRPTHAAPSPAHCCRGRAPSSSSPSSSRSSPAAALPARLSLAAVATREQQPRRASVRRGVH